MTWPAPTFGFGDFVTVRDRFPGVVVAVDPARIDKYLVAMWDHVLGAFSMWCGHMDIVHELEAH